MMRLLDIEVAEHGTIFEETELICAMTGFRQRFLFHHLGEGFFDSKTFTADEKAPEEHSGADKKASDEPIFQENSFKDEHEDEEEEEDKHKDEHDWNYDDYCWSYLCSPWNWDWDHYILWNWDTISKGQDVVKEAQGYMDSPYRLGYASRSGIDCSGLTMMAYRKFDVSLPHDVKKQYRYGSPVQGEPKAGDLVFFDEHGEGISHVGIATGKGTVVHASDYRHKVTETKLEHLEGYEGARRLLSS